MRLSPKSLATVLPLFILLCGCSSHSANPVTPAADTSDPLIMDEVPDGDIVISENRTQDYSSRSNKHLLVLFSWYFDPETGTFDVVPAREAQMHYNVIGPLENAGALTVAIVPEETDPASGIITVDVSITNPFDNSPTLCVFDVHGIIIAPGSRLCRRSDTAEAMISGFSTPTVILDGGIPTSFPIPDYSATTRAYSDPCSTGLMFLTSVPTRSLPTF